MTSPFNQELRTAVLAVVGLLPEEVTDCGEGLDLARSGCLHLGCHTHWRLISFGFTLEGLTNLKEQLRHIDAVLIFPRMPTWSRLPALNRLGPKPLRSRDFPWGRPGISQLSSQRVDHENTLLFMTLDISRGLLSTGDTMTDGRNPPRFALLQPEDLGPLPSFHPVSLWQVAELRSLARHGGLMRSAFHQCRHQRAPHSRPTGLLSNFMLPHGTSKSGWPRFRRATGQPDSYIAPLSKQCGCGSSHTSMRRRHGRFRTTDRMLEQGTARLLGAAVALDCAAADCGQDDLRWKGAVKHTLQAVLPDLCEYPVDDQGYDTEGTVLLDPPDSDDDEGNDLRNCANQVLPLDGIERNVKGATKLVKDHKRTDREEPEKVTLHEGADSIKHHVYFRFDIVISLNVFVGRSLTAIIHFHVKIGSVARLKVFSSCSLTTTFDLYTFM